MLDWARARTGSVWDTAENPAACWPTARQFRLIEVFDGETEGDDHHSANDLEAAEHGGPHLDARLAVVALPMKIEGGSGGPLRIKAVRRP